jgi:hypothetical protein
MEVVTDPQLSKRDKIIINVLNLIGWVAVLAALGDVVIQAIVSDKPLSTYIWVACAVITLVGLGLVGLASIWPITKKHSAAGNITLQYLNRRDTELSDAIVTASLRSAYARWFSAQILINSGRPIEHSYLISTAANEVMDQIVDGDIAVRRRRPGQIAYEPIPATYWNSTIFYVVEDQASLWKVNLGPKGGIEFTPHGKIARASNAEAAARTSQLAAYDSLLIDANEFERLWPKIEPNIDKKTRRFLWKAFWRRLDKNERQRLRRS